MNVGRGKHHSKKEITIRRFRRCDRRHYLPKLVNLNIHPPKLNDGDKRELVFFLFITALYIVCIAKYLKKRLNVSVIRKDTFCSIHLEHEIHLMYKMK